MAKKQGDVVSAHSADRNKTKGAEVMALATLKDLRKRAGQTQEEMAAALGVGQETISRLEKRSDMLLSTLHHYVESIGGRLALVATFPNQPPVVIDHRGDKKRVSKKRERFIPDHGEP